MPRFRTFAAALLVGGALFAAGAFAQGIGRWTTGSPMPSARTEVAPRSKNATRRPDDGLWSRIPRTWMTAALNALGFAIEALLLVWIGIVRAQMLCKPTGKVIHLASLGVFLFALVVQPLIGPLMGRSWQQVEIFGIAPDPTVIATLGILLLASNRSLWRKRE